VIRRRIADKRASRQRLKDAAKSYGIYGLKETKHAAPFVGGDGHPAAMELIGHAVGSGSISDPFFRLSSAIDHGSLHGTSRLLSFDTLLDGQRRSTVRPLTADDLALPVPRPCRRC